VRGEGNLFSRNANTRPLTTTQAALNATQPALKLSKKYRRRLHILHLSTAEEAELLRQDKPSWVTAEVTPQHLLLNTSAYEKIGTLAQMNPPLRSPLPVAV
jgi:dihydroorotase